MFCRLEPQVITLQVLIGRICRRRLPLDQTEKWVAATPPPRTAVKPILFLSRLLSPAEKNYWPTELEVACLVWAVRKTRHLIEDCQSAVVIYTDHSATCEIARHTHLGSSSIDRIKDAPIQDQKRRSFAARTTVNLTAEEKKRLRNIGDHCFGKRLHTS
ncbi:hypothetical protein N7472_010296 [Penicillium cf. griseofulvum]|uniref:Reverse transcriptase RNase H-like domain-containing protein n=1 Tax=Penicillium cf. griseofulvum TaxID=2972120 RepID=A0A9W9M0X0_9EURO|nr:hypothetical protein N7472_010296 [Penicillium cf. griseofulvum]